jgi:hypothetical protein
MHVYVTNDDVATHMELIAVTASTATPHIA